jgi:hypothetical protein
MPAAVVGAPRLVGRLDSACGVVRFRDVAAFQAREDPPPGAINPIFGLSGGALLGRLLRPLITVVRHGVSRKGSETLVEVS